MFRVEYTKSLHIEHCDGVSSDSGLPRVNRYILDDDSGIRTFIEEQVSQSTGSHGSQTSDMELPWLPQSVKDFWLPTGFPGNICYTSIPLNHFLSSCLLVVPSKPPRNCVLLLFL